jgi:IMP dehydrogenase
MNKRQFFDAMAVQGLALSFDDVRLIPGYSVVVPTLVDITTKFTRRVGLKCPIVSSPMDTVTESRMAIAMAMAGGIGVIHRNLEPERQAAEVARVKSHLNALILKPVTVFGDESIEQIERRRAEEGYSFQSFPVINRKGRLIGLITKNDFDMCDDTSLKAETVMTHFSSLITATSGTDINEAYRIMEEEKKKVLPLVTDERAIEGMYVFSDVKRILTRSQEGYNTDARGHLLVAAAIGTGEESLQRAALLIKEQVDVLVIDTAHGDSKPVFDILKALKAMPEASGIDIVAGNVSVGAAAKRLVEAGADGIRVGQGPGSICTTRIIAGIGCPQVTAVHECSTAIEGSEVPIIADGGIKHSGDIPIAIGVGAHAVMLGKLLAGTDEAPGDLVTIRGVPHKRYRGMGSLGAMQENEASRQRYGERSTSKDRFVPEGIEGAVPYKGPVTSELLQQIGGLRRGMGYVGAATLEELRQKAELYRITGAGLNESHPHSIVITDDAPNYRKANQ